MKITNNGGGSYCVGGEAPGTLLLNLTPGDNEIDSADWNKCKDKPAVAGAVRSGRLVVGGNQGAAPSKAHLVQHEGNQRAEAIASGAQPTAHDQAVANAAKEKEDFGKYPTMGMPEKEALAFIGGCEDKEILEACYSACESGKDSRPSVKAAIESRAAELKSAEGSNDD